MKSSNEYLPFGTTYVPNVHPKKTAPYRIAFIGEAPGENEEQWEEPFKGPSGWLLTQEMGEVNIDRNAVFLGNIFQYRPYNNLIETVNRNSDEWRISQEQLARDLESFQPNLVVLLGNTALEVFTGKDKITNWRGSIIAGKFGEHGYKCLPSVHPAACLRDYSLTPLLRFDLERAYDQGMFPEIRRSERQLDVDLTFDEIMDEFDHIETLISPIAFDIEGGCDTMSCISFACSPTYAFTIPFQTLQGNYKSGSRNSVWSRDEESQLLRRIASILSNPGITKITQNGISYDAFVLAFSYRIPVNNIEDIMLLNWELFPEQPKSLGFQISIWIDEPYHKEGRKAVNDHDFWRYCAKDSATTLEIWYAQNAYVDAADHGESIRKHYMFNRDVAIAMLYTSLRGMVYDTNLVAVAAKEIQAKLAEHQKYLNDKFGDCSFTTKPKVKKKRMTKAEKIFAAMEDLFPVEDVAPTVRGTFNVKSTKQKQALVYDLKGYTYFNRKTKSRTSTDEMTLVTLANKHQDDDLWELIRAIRCRTALSSLALDESGQPSRRVVDSDGRIRFSYNVVGTETGRTSCYKSNSGSGFNGQTITKTKGCNMRKFYLADPGYMYLQADLEGADSWTVAAYCKALGDSSMYDHLVLGIKPAKVLRAVLAFGLERVMACNPEDLRVLSKAAPDDELYRVCKAVGHGTCYKMGPTLVGDIVYKQTEGKINFSPKQCEAYQNIYLSLYPGVPQFHEYIFRLVSQQGYIDCASGHRRPFLSIRWSKDPYGNKVIDHETHRQALAEEPQANTTFVTNQILHNLYYQDYNRREGSPNPFIIEPLHQVHDAINGQVRISDVQSGLAKEVFDRAKDVELIIAGMPIKIPIDCKLGPSWGETTHNIDGSLILK